MGYATFVTSKAGPTKEVVFHKGALSKLSVLLYILGDEQNKIILILYSLGGGGGGGNNVLGPPLG